MVKEMGRTAFLGAVGKQLKGSKDKHSGSKQKGGQGETNLVNQSNNAILNNGYYEVNGFKFSEYYYNKLWNTGRGAPSLVAKEVLKGGGKNAIPHALKPGFNKYIYGGWEMIYNPTTKEVWHLQPIIE